MFGIAEILLAMGISRLLEIGLLKSIFLPGSSMLYFWGRTIDGYDMSIVSSQGEENFVLLGWCCGGLLLGPVGTGCH